MSHCCLPLVQGRSPFSPRLWLMLLGPGSQLKRVLVKHCRSSTQDLASSVSRGTYGGTSRGGGGDTWMWACPPSLSSSLSLSSSQMVGMSSSSRLGPRMWGSLPAQCRVGVGRVVPSLRHLGAVLAGLPGACVFGCRPIQRFSSFVGGIGCDRSWADLLCVRPLCIPCCHPGWVGRWGYCAGDGLGGRGVV